MGLGNFFRNLFGGSKPKFAPEELDINITDNAIFINGNTVNCPCHLDTLKKLFGKPRRSASQSGNGNVTFTWDGLGVYCYTKGNNVVHCFAIRANHGGIETHFDPKCMFKGKLNINGSPWEKVMYSGEDMEIAKACEVGGLSLFADYADVNKGDSEGFNGAYTGVEVQYRIYN